MTVAYSGATPTQGFLLAGRWTERTEYFDVVDPDDGSTISTVAKAGIRDVDTAVAAAQAALAEPLPTHRRRDVLFRVAQRLADERDESAQLIAREGIKTIREARAEAVRAAQTIGLSAEEAAKNTGQTLGLDRTANGIGRFGLAVSEPLGVIAAITPFNDPLNLVAHKVGPALATGNTIVLKPDSKTPLSALRLARLFTEEGLPPGWLQVLPGDGAVIGKHLASHGDVAMISFTGGLEVGRRIAAVSGFKALSMELGANNAAIVEPDADLEVAIDRLASGMFWAAGQNCLHVQRIYAHEAIVDALIDGLASKANGIRLGPKLDTATDMGPLIDSDAQDRILGIIGEAKQRGAGVITGGSTVGPCIEPTLLTDLAPQSRALTEEIYGPVTTISTYTDRRAAITAANDTTYGLAGSVFTTSLNTAFEIAASLKVGSVMINDSTDYRDDAMPFGGEGDSGIGREGVPSAASHMISPKTITLTDVAVPGLG